MQAYTVASDGRAVPAGIFRGPVWADRASSITVAAGQPGRICMVWSSDPDRHDGGCGPNPGAVLPLAELKGAGRVVLSPDGSRLLALAHPDAPHRFVRLLTLDEAGRVTAQRQGLLPADDENCRGPVDLAWDGSDQVIVHCPPVDDSPQLWARQSLDGLFTGIPVAAYLRPAGPLAKGYGVYREVVPNSGRTAVAVMESHCPFDESCSAADRKPDRLVTVDVVSGRVLAVLMTTGPGDSLELVSHAGADTVIHNVNHADGSTSLVVRDSRGTRDIRGVTGPLGDFALAA